MTTEHRNYDTEIRDRFSRLQRGEALPEVPDDDAVGRIIDEKAQELFGALLEQVAKDSLSAAGDVELLLSATMDDVADAYERCDRHRLALAIAGIYFSNIKRMLPKEAIEFIEKKMNLYPWETCSDLGIKYDMKFMLDVPAQIFGIPAELVIHIYKYLEERSRGCRRGTHYGYYFEPVTSYSVVLRNKDNVCVQQRDERDKGLADQFREAVKKIRG